MQFELIVDNSIADQFVRDFVTNGRHRYLAATNGRRDHHNSAYAS